MDQPDPAADLSPTGPPPTPTVPPTEPKAKRRLGVRDPLSIVLILVIVLSLAAAGLIGAELYARNRADNKVAAAAACVVEDDATASFGAMPPFLWQHMNRDYTNITITTAGNQIKRAKGMKADISLDDVQRHGGQFGKGTIGKLRATITWSSDGIKETIHTVVPVVGSLVSGVTTNPSNRTIELKAMFGSIVAEPQVVNNTISLKLIESTVLGLSFPPELVQSTLDALANQLANNYPLHARADRIDVTDDGVVGYFSSPDNEPIPTGNPCFENL